MDMIFCPLYSGSSGNCAFVQYGRTRLLVDAGKPGKTIQDALQDIGVAPESLDGILITHEHADHINGLGVMSRKYEIPIYATEGTIEAIRNTSGLGTIDPSLFIAVREEEKFTIKDLTVNPMKISHDAAQPVAYRISYGKKRVAICTDLGVYNDYTVECLKDLDAVLLEANHDVNMLQVGPYPYHLKQRILGNRGHLSNENSGRLLGKILHDKLKTIILGHLSKENNYPELAYELVELLQGINACGRSEEQRLNSSHT